MKWLMLLLSLSAFAKEPLHWSSALRITERHEHYTNNQTIEKPSDSWQTLFAVVYPIIDLSLRKDCVYFRVPGGEPGILKIKTTTVEIPCEKGLFLPGDSEWSDIKSLQFSTHDESIIVNLTRGEYKSEKWIIELQNTMDPVEPKMHMSSSEYKVPKIMLLSPLDDTVLTTRPVQLKDKEICHNVTDDCQELSPSACLQCPEGWYEVPNGCPQGPKFCGLQDCGKKDQPACRRGMKWQRVEKEYDCLSDPSFAYCNKGSVINCRGRQAFCL